MQNPANQRPTPTRSVQGRAFSLVELVVVVAILGLVAAIAAPRYGAATGRYRCEMAARRLIADLGAAQDKARACSAPVIVHLYPTKAWYIVENTAPNASPNFSKTDLGADPYFVTYERITLDNGNDDITFDGYGTIDTAGVISLSSGAWLARVTISDKGGPFTYALSR
jgi:prepilin-type N-terminal cleavage/methylation domain-containing protein